MQFVRFLLTGGVAALVNLGSRYVLDIFLSFEVAVALSFCFGVTTAYTLARIFVFSTDSGPDGAEFSRFLFVNLLALILVWLVSVGLARLVFPWIGMTWYPFLVAHAIGVVSPIAFSYFLHKRYTFR